MDNYICDASLNYAKYRYTQFLFPHRIIPDIRTLRIESDFLSNRDLPPFAAKVPKVLPFRFSHGRHCDHPDGCNTVFFLRYHRSDMLRPALRSHRGTAVFLQ